MTLNNLKSLKRKSKKIVGRGISSGKGKTAGRGAKGQKKRTKIPLGFEGGQLPLYKRLPQKRGIGNSPMVKGITITTRQLNLMPDKSTVDEGSLQEFGIVKKSVRKIKIKIVASGKLDKSLKVNFPATKKAVNIIKKAGGSSLNENPA